MNACRYKALRYKNPFFTFNYTRVPKNLKTLGFADKNFWRQEQMLSIDTKLPGAKISQILIKIARVLLFWNQTKITKVTNHI